MMPRETLISWMFLRVLITQMFLFRTNVFLFRPLALPARVLRAARPPPPDTAGAGADLPGDTVEGRRAAPRAGAFLIFC